MTSRESALHPTNLRIDPSVWVAPDAVVVGDVSVGARSSVWYGCVLRGDLEPIRIGEETNVQDLTVIHVDRGLPAVLGDRVTVGHRAVIHGCLLGDDAVVGMGAVLLSGSRVGRGALVAAGAVVLEGFEVPDGAIAAGVPAKLRGEVPPELRRRFLDGVRTYVDAARSYLAGDLGGGPLGGRASGRP